MIIEVLLVGSKFDCETGEMVWLCISDFFGNSSTVEWVSASCDLAVSWLGWPTRSLRSTRKSPLLVRMVLPDFLATMTWALVSITASKALSKVFDSKKGVDPGTMAIFSCKPSIGTIMACSLFRVPWFPKRNVMLQAHLLTSFRISGCKLLRKSAT